jgi:ubiquinone/menaquinone biosynthesis C-methylase UbiE
MGRIMETSKARERRIREGFFNKYCNGKGIDIGCGSDVLSEACDKWDSIYNNSDATYMQGIEDNTYDFVYSSHCLEHIINRKEALKNWVRILKPEGYLILFLPERDLYEKRKKLPSKFNGDHKIFFKLDEEDPPDTECILKLLFEALPTCSIIYAKICDEGHTITDPNLHSDGEFSIEIVLRKNK